MRARIAALPARVRAHGWWALWAVLGVGLLLRIAVTAFYGATIFNYYGGDSTRYMRLGVSGVHGLFGDNAMPAGYPAFLAVMRHLDAWLPLTTMVQHLLGLAGGVLLYAALRTLRAPRWAALVPAAVVALSGDHIYVEHGILTEALWMPLLALSAYLLARAIAAPRPEPWLAAGGVALAVATMTRSVSEALPVVLAVWAAVALGGSGAERLRRGAALLLPALAVLGAYYVIANPISGGYSGLSEDRGFSLYARVAQFADCADFTPPDGTASLCVDTPTSERRGPFYWAWSPESPLYAKFHFDIHDAHEQQQLTEFARAAILHQPLEYALTAGRDFARFFVPQAGDPRPDSGTDETLMSFQNQVPTAQGATPEALAGEFEEAYEGVGDGTPDATAITVFGTYQSLFRIDGRLLALLILGCVCGCVLGTGPVRRGAWLFTIAGIVLLAIPPMFSSYDVRYSIPPIDLFAAGAGLGLAALAQARSAKRSTETIRRIGYSS